MLIKKQNKIEIDIDTLNIGALHRYNILFYSQEEHKSIQETIYHNRNAISFLLKSIENGSEKPIEIDVNKIRKNLKQKYKKFTISRDYNIGNVYTFGANIEEDDEYKMLIVPEKNVYKNPYAYIRFRYYKRDKFFNLFINKLIMALKTSKISFEHKIIKIKGTNYIEFYTTNPFSNEAFWGTLKVWSSH